VRWARGSVQVFLSVDLEGSVRLLRFGAASHITVFSFAMCRFYLHKTVVTDKLY
jgi:hypothetical protein